MANLQSYWGQIELNVPSQIKSISEGFLDFLKGSKTEWEVREFIRNKLLQFRFSDISKVSQALPGTGFFVELDEGCIAAGMFGTSNIHKRGLNIVGCPIDAGSLDVSSRGPGMMEGTDISTVRFTPLYGDLDQAWLSTNVSVHVQKALSDGSRKSVVVGGTRKEPGFIVTSVPEKLTDKGKKTKKQYDLVLGIDTSPVEKGKKQSFPGTFLNSIGMAEKELISARLSLVPSLNPNEIGSNRSMIQGFGAIERLPVYGALKALTDLTRIEDNVLVIFYTTKGECSKKGHIKEITEKAVESILKKIVDKPTGDLVREVLEYSRVLNITCLKQKTSSKSSEEGPPKTIPIGKGPVVGTSSTAAKSTKSQRLLGIIEDNLEKTSTPYLKLQKNYDFNMSDTIGEGLSKILPESLYASPISLGSRNLCSTVSKIDIWATYRAILIYCTH